MAVKNTETTPEEILTKPVEETGIDAHQMATEASQEDILKMLVSASEYKKDADQIVTISIRRDGKPVVPPFRVHPLDEKDIDLAHKKSTRFGPNPQGRRLPKIELETDTGLENSWIIYLATVDEDKEKLWNNPTLIRGLQAAHPEVIFAKGSEGAQMIDLVFKPGEKSYAMNKVIEMTYPQEQDVDGNNAELEYAKN